MDSVLIPIPSHKLNDVWDKVKDRLKTAVDLTSGRINIDDAKRLIEDKSWVLWVSLRDGKVEAIACTEILNYPHKKMCMVRIMSGEDYFNWIGLENNIAKWAKSIGCHGMEGYCRKGWQKIFKDYTSSHVLIERMF